MIEQKIHAVLEELGVPEDQFSDFVMSLGSVHQQISAALQLAPLIAGQQEDDSGEASVDDFMADFLRGFNNSFELGGVASAANYIVESLGIYGVSVNISGTESSMEFINSFIKQYGLKEFFADNFTEEFYFSVSQDSEEKLDPSKIPAKTDIPPEEVIPEDDDIEPGAELFDENIENIFEEFFSTSEGRMSGRNDDIRVPKKIRPLNISKQLDVKQNTYRNIDTSHSFFEAEESSFNYAKRLSAAKVESEVVNELNFHPVFRSLGADADGIIIDDSSGDPVVMTSLDKMSRVRQAVLGELNILKNETAIIQANLESAVSGDDLNIRSAIASYDEKRRLIANRVDDLLSAIKYRDSYITNKIYKEYKGMGIKVDAALRGRAYELSAEFRNKSSSLTESLAWISNGLVFLDIQKEVFHLGSSDSDGIPEKFKENYDTRLAEAFTEVFSHYLHNKIRDFFSRSSTGAWVRSSYCGWLARTVKRRNLALLAYNKTLSVKTKHWNYSSCSVCGKDIYTRSSIISPKGSGRGDSADKLDYSEYSVPSYSLFTNDGRLLDEAFLKYEDDGVTERAYSYSKSEYEGPKTWSEITALISSGSKAFHIEGAKRRADALSQLGARLMSKSDSAISEGKYKCPYSDDADRPESLLRSISDANAKWKPKVQDFECGLYLDPDPIIASKGEVLPSSLQTKRRPFEGSSAGIFEAKLDSAVKAGDIDESVKQRFLEEFKRRAGGGWKFSNKFFNCPTRIEIPDEHKTVKGVEENQYLKKYSYIASPISGPKRDGSISFDEASGGIDINNTSFYPAKNVDGSFYIPENGTMTYLVCGAKTSLSSFLRDSNEEGSLPRLVKDFIEEIEDDPESAFKVQTLIETLIGLGVDVQDLLPFLGNINQPSMAIEALESSGRLEKISGILAVAMAAPVNLEKPVRGTPYNRTEILSKLKLVCNHGHVFSILDSVYFGRTHTGINLRNKSTSAYNSRNIIESGLLFGEGVENFKSSLRLSDKSGRKYIQTVDESELIGQDSTRRYMYEEWRGLKSPAISRTIFSESPGSFYGFSSVPRTFIWGSEERAKLSSARERETADSATRTYLETSEELSIGGHKDEDGKLVNYDAASSAAYNKWKESSGSGFSFSIPAMVELGPEGYAKNTAIIGKMLRSFLMSMRGWMKLATALEIQSPLSGTPEPVDMSNLSASEIFVSGSRNIFEAVVRAVEDELNEDVSDETSALIKESFEVFYQNYLMKLDNVDKKVLYLSKDTVKEYLSIGIVKSIFGGIPKVFPEDAKMVAQSYMSTLAVSGVVDYDLLYSDYEYAGKNVGTIMDEMISHLKPSEMSEKDQSRVLYDPMATGKGSGWYESGNISKEGVTDKISKMKGKEYMGRVLEGASAMYVADVVSRLYNLYMSDASSSTYIGYDIGLDLSDPDKILSLTEEDVRSIVVGVSGPDVLDMDEDSLTDFYDNHFDNIMKCSTSLESSIFALRTACTSSKYMKKATEYITSALSEMVDEVDDGTGDKDIERARLIIDNVMTNQPFSTISLNSDGKYRKFFGGSDSSNPEVIVPSFGGVLLKYNSDRNNSFYPIFKLVDGAGVYHSFDIDINPPSGYRSCYVLSKENLPNSLEEDAIQDALPENYRKSGWKILSVTVGRGKEEYSDITGKSSGWMEGVSLIYHPDTQPIVSEDGSTIGYRNDSVGMNTSETLFAGPLSVRRGNAMSFPPNPYSQSNVGVPIPIDFKGSAVTSSDLVFPVIGTRIPVEISSSESPAPVSLDMSDFLQRDPPGEALNIIFKIEKLYKEYQNEVRLSVVDRRGDEHRESLKRRYKTVISNLHETYRGLPLNVASANISTAKERGSVSIHDESGGVSSRFKPNSSLYLPFLDWTTMYRILSSDAFGPEWGGHQLWTPDESDDDLKRMRKQAVEEFIIRTNNLELLAKQVGLRLDSVRKVPAGTTVIDPRDLLDPVGRLLGGGIVSKAEVRQVFGQTIEAALTDLGDSEMPWVGLEDIGGRDRNASGAMLKRFPLWTKGMGSFYSVGSVSREDSVSGDPFAYIKIMNSVFPSNKSGSKGVSPRQRLDAARNPDMPDIISVDDLYDHPIISGAGSSPTYYPVPQDEGGLKKYRKDLKGVRHVSVVRYAEAISEYLEEFVKRELLTPLDQQRANDNSVKSGADSFGLVKFSKKLNAKIYFGATINDRRLLHLWSLINN